MSGTGPARPAGDVVVSAGHVVLPETTLSPGWIQVGGATLAAVGAGPPPRSPDLRADDGWLLPGFVDLHVHGGGGADFTAAEPEAVARTVGFHRSHGTTTLLASLVTAEPGQMEAALTGLADLADEGLVTGIHLEGPWIAPARCGAHEPRFLRIPSADAVDRLLRAGRGYVRVVTLAPELDGGEDAVRQLVSSGVVAAIGHTDADYELTRRAVAAGARLATHLYNAMPPLHHRAPGPVAALLEAPGVSVELVLDGIHVHPAMAQLAADRAGPDRVLLVSDAMAAAGMADGEYWLGSQEVRVRAGVARLMDSDVLAGSTLTMDAAWRFAVQRCGWPPSQASRAASTNPARMLGFAGSRGALVPGQLADVVLLDRSMQVQRVMVAGRWVR